MKQFSIVVAIAVLAMTKAAFADNSPAAMLVARVVGSMSQNSQATIGALPPGWTSPVPLPANVPILGAISYGSTRVTVYYAPTDAQAAYAEYTGVLKAAGFVQHPRNGPPNVVFSDAAASLPAFDLYCKDKQPVNLAVGGGSEGDLRVTVTSEALSLNPCIDRNDARAASSPLPALSSPQATNVTNIGGISSRGSGLNGDSVEVNAGALIIGKTSARELMKSYIAQMQRAGWRMSSSSIASNGGGALFSFGTGEKAWNAMVAVFPTAKPSQLQAIVTARGGSLSRSAFSSPKLPSIPTTIARSDLSAFARLARMMATNGQPESVAVFVGKAPPELDGTVPLPAGRLIGSTSSKPSPASQPGNAGVDTLYYELAESQLSAYLGGLAKTGWINWLPMRQQSGFTAVSRDRTLLAYCKSGFPRIDLWTRSDSNYVVLNVSRGVTKAECPPQPFAGPPQVWALPQLRLPGTSPKPGWGSFGATAQGSSASFDSSVAVAELLDGFAVQMTKAGWTSASRNAAENSAGATFAYVDAAGKHWVATLALYRAPGDTTNHVFIEASRSD